MSLPEPQVANDGNSLTPAYELVRALQRENDQLRHALESRIVVEQAKGAVSARFGLTPDEAFELIRGLARSQRRRIHELAAEVVRNRGALHGVEGDGKRPLGSTAAGRARGRTRAPAQS